jgi:aspartate aminotransferase
MFENLVAQPNDKILALMNAFRADPRQDKIDLGVGVYRNADGQTPVMGAVKAAELRLWQDETTKTYTSMTGDAAFGSAMTKLMLGDAINNDRVASSATPGGTGAIRLALELVQMASPNATVWLSQPTWPNHPAILKYLKMPTRGYRYFDEETRGVDFDGMCADLEAVMPGDVVLLHGCCHNPTGANLSMTQWADVATLLIQSGALPLIDIAYQGFGDGLDADAAPLRLLAQSMPEVLVAASCSKSFGIYRDRAGLLMTITPGAAETSLAQENLAALNRMAYSFPPDHGTRLVGMILNDPALTAQWAAELETVRTDMLGLRQQLAHLLQDLTGSDRFAALAAHRGMFSLLKTTPEQVVRLRDEHGIYMVGDGRVNIAGLNAYTVPILAQALVACGV